MALKKQQRIDWYGPDGSYARWMGGDLQIHLNRVQFSEESLKDMTFLPMIPVRYQDCRWYVKLWRRRHYLLIPFQALKFYRNKRLNDTTFRDCWSVATGLAQGRMNWTFTWAELKHHKFKL